MDLVDGRGGEIRTHDPLYPKQVRYQTAPRPDRGGVLQRVAGHGNHLEREDAKSFKYSGPLSLKDKGPTGHSRVHFDIPGLPPIRSPPRFSALLDFSRTKGDTSDRIRLTNAAHG